MRDSYSKTSLLFTRQNFIVSTTQSHQVFFGRPLCLVPSVSIDHTLLDPINFTFNMYTSP